MSRKVIGDKYEYELNQKLGSGAFAEVFKGKNKLTGEVVAVKVIKRSILDKYGYVLNIYVKFILINQEMTC